VLRLQCPASPWYNDQVFGSEQHIDAITVHLERIVQISGFRPWNDPKLIISLVGLMIPDKKKTGIFFKKAGK
jgi:hypothetical protein